jgi:hypothetical protein
MTNRDAEQPISRFLVLAYSGVTNRKNMGMDMNMNMNMNTYTNTNVNAKRELECEPERKREHEHEHEQEHDHEPKNETNTDMNKDMDTDMRLTWIPGMNIEFCVTFRRVNFVIGLFYHCVPIHHRAAVRYKAVPYSTRIVLWS